MIIAQQAAQRAQQAAQPHDAQTPNFIAQQAAEPRQAPTPRLKAQQAAAYLTQRQIDARQSGWEYRSNSTNAMMARVLAETDQPLRPGDAGDLLLVSK